MLDKIIVFEDERKAFEKEILLLKEKSSVSQNLENSKLHAIKENEALKKRTIELNEIVLKLTNGQKITWIPKMYF